MQATSKWNLHAKYQITTTKNCGRLTLYRQTDIQTERSMKTEGPILVKSPCLASYSHDLEWSNKTINTTLVKVTTVTLYGNDHGHVTL